MKGVSKQASQALEGAKAHGEAKQQTQKSKQQQATDPKSSTTKPTPSRRDSASQPVDADASAATEAIDEIESHTIVQFGDDLNMKVYMFGGYINNMYISNRMFLLTPKGYTRAFDLQELAIANESRVPMPRHDHGMTASLATAAGEANSIYVFGGVLSQMDKRCNEFWHFDTTALRWTFISGKIDHAIENLAESESK